MVKESCTKFSGVLVSLHEAIELQSFQLHVSDVIPLNAQKISPPVFFAYIIFTFMEIKPPITFYGVFDHFSRTYKVVKLWMIKYVLT